MKKITLLFAAIISSSLGFAQGVASDLPPLVPGKCYAKCYIADVWGTETEKVLVKEASQTISTTPAVYETKTERVLDKAESKRLVVVPATYKTVTEKVIAKEASTKLVPVAPVYGYETETILVKDATTKWVKKKDKSCLSANPDDCMIICAVEVPAVYETYKKRVLKTPATTKTIEIPATYKTITSTVVNTPATTKEVVIPATYKNVTSRVLVTPAKQTVKTIPAEYKTISKKKLVKKGGYTEWKEVVCGGWSGMTQSKIAKVQNALMSKGYNVGPYGADGILGKDTRSALLKYQVDNNLPQGQLDVETLKHLGASGM